MKAYFKRFGILYGIVAVLLIVYIIMASVHSGTEIDYVRTNTECMTEERVFDYADKLTDEEEASLRELIAQREKQTGCDIVLLVMNEPVGDSHEDLMNYADDFYDENKFGFDKPYGDGVLYVDNWYSYGDYNGDTWLSTSGKVEDRYSEDLIDYLIDDVTSITNENPYEAYTCYVNDVYEDMEGKLDLSPLAIFIVALLVTIIYLVIHLSAQKGKKTTTATTYVEGGKPTLNNKRDVFVSKHVVTRKIESSSSGGGGHHTSSGGHSHGGGGGHH